MDHFIYIMTWFTEDQTELVVERAAFPFDTRVEAEAARDVLARVMMRDFELSPGRVLKLQVIGPHYMSKLSGHRGVYMAGETRTVCDVLVIGGPAFDVIERDAAEHELNSGRHTVQ